MTSRQPRADRSNRRAPRRERLGIAAGLALAMVVAACGQASSVSPSVAGARLSPVAPAAATGAGAAATGAAEVPLGTALPGSSPVTVGAEVARITLPQARSRSVAFVLGSAIVVSGGLTSAGTTTGSILTIDAGSGRVRTFGSLASPVHDAGGAVLDGAGFVVGGGRLVADSLVQRIGSTGKAATVGRLPAPRADLAAVAIDGEIIVVGGGTPAQPDDRVLATTDGRHFRVIGRLVAGVRYPAVAVFDGSIYVIGGSTLWGDTRLIEVIDPRSGDVRVVGRLSHGLSHASAFVVGGALLVAGGRSAGRAQDAILRFDAAAGTATMVGRMPYAASDMAAVVLGGTGYLIGGEAAHPIASIVTVALK